MSARPDYTTIQKAFRWLLARPGSVVEVRTIEQYRGRCQVGYFNDIDVVANAVTHSDNEGLTGIYATLNPVHPDLFARCSNRMISAVAGQFTKDQDIIERRGLLLDFDVKRPSGITGISSTNEEHQLALTHMQEVAEDLTLWHGFPVPCLVDSGNGGHAKYMLDPLPNDPETTALIRLFLQCCHYLYKNPFVDIDQTVFNASRIARIPGTPARKGEDTPERPHRVSRIIRDFDPLDTLSRGTIERFVNRYAPRSPEVAQRLSADPQRHLREYPADETIYRTLNRTAKLRYHEYCSSLLGEFTTPAGDEYRIYKDKLNRSEQESIRIGTYGIKDYGVHDMGDETEGRRQAVTLVSELLTNGDKAAAANLLSICLNTPVNEFSGKALIPVTTDPITMPEALMGTPGFAMPKNGYYDVDLLGLKYTKWLIPQFVIENGYTMVSAPTKMGKSTLTKQMIAACLVGGELLGVSCQKCEVLYIAYEDMADDIIRDVRHMLTLALKDLGVQDQNIPGEITRALKGFHYYAREMNEAGEFFHRVPTGRAGLDFIEKLTREQLPEVRVTCIDPIRLLNDETLRSRNIVTQQYHEGLDMLNLAVKGQTAIWGLHHHNKEAGKKVSEGNDPTLSVGGTAAMTGAAQNIIVFEGDRVPEGVDGATGLYLSSRIEQSKAKIIKMHNNRFYLAPPDTEIYYRRNQPKTGDPEVDNKIIEVLNKLSGMTAPAISEALNIPKYTVDRRLNILKAKELVDFTEDVDRIHHDGRRGPPAKIWFLNKPISLPKTT